MTDTRYSRASGFFYPYGRIVRQSSVALRAQLSQYVWLSAGFGAGFWAIMYRNEAVIGWPRQAGWYVYAQAWWQAPDPNWWLI